MHVGSLSHRLYDCEVINKPLNSAQTGTLPPSPDSPPSPWAPHPPHTQHSAWQTFWGYHILVILVDQGALTCREQRNIGLGAHGPAVSWEEGRMTTFCSALHSVWQWLSKCLYRILGGRSLRTWPSRYNGFHRETEWAIVASLVSGLAKLPLTPILPFTDLLTNCQE